MYMINLILLLQVNFKSFIKIYIKSYIDLYIGSRTYRRIYIHI